jgi:hypothetical protein
VPLLDLTIHLHQEQFYLDTVFWRVIDVQFCDDAADVMARVHKVAGDLVNPSWKITQLSPLGRVDGYGSCVVLVMWLTSAFKQYARDEPTKDIFIKCIVVSETGQVTLV